MGGLEVSRDVIRYVVVDEREEGRPVLVVQAHSCQRRGQRVRIGEYRFLQIQMR